MQQGPELSENLEDYLEAILELEQTQKVARAKDIADKLGVQRASVTGALKSLDKKGLINYQPYSFITLTTKGAKIARKITRHHEVLKDFLVKVLQIAPQAADETACRMEHAITDETIERLIFFIDKLYNCPRTGTTWIQSVNRDCAQGPLDRDKCLNCISECSRNLQEE